MYQVSTPLFIYAVSPVHMGGGTALGLVDNPIQRERHTEYPTLAGSGLKGAVRHHILSRFDDDSRKNNGAGTLLTRLFGPDAGDLNLHAGAVSFGDAQLVAFPVRCTRRAYVYATSPVALARTARLLTMLKTAHDWPAIPEDIGDGSCHTVQQNAPVENGATLSLEVFQYNAVASAELQTIAEWLAEHAVPKGTAYDFFRDKLKRDLVLLPDDDFSHFVNNATVVEPHVRIDDATGAAKEGGLFYTENLPPESLLVAPLMASRERSNKQNLSAGEVLKTVLEGDPTAQMPALDGAVVQIGGDATTGRGQVVFTAVEG